MVKPFFFFIFFVSGYLPSQLQLRCKPKLTDVELQRNFYVHWHICSHTLLAKYQTPPSLEMRTDLTNETQKWNMFEFQVQASNLAANNLLYRRTFSQKSGRDNRNLDFQKLQMTYRKFHLQFWTFLKKLNPLHMIRKKAWNLAFRGN